MGTRFNHELNRLAEIKAIIESLEQQFKDEDLSEITLLQASELAKKSNEVFSCIYGKGKFAISPKTALTILRNGPSGMSGTGPLWEILEEKIGDN